MIAAYSTDNRSITPYVQSDQSRMAARRLGWDSFFPHPLIISRTAGCSLGLTLKPCVFLVTLSGQVLGDEADRPGQLRWLRLRAPHLKKKKLCHYDLVPHPRRNFLLYEKAFCQPRHTGPKGLQSRLHGNWPCQNTSQHTPPRSFLHRHPLGLNPLTLAACLRFCGLSIRLP